MGFILASASPRRSGMLSQLDLDFQIIPADIDEDYIAGETPGEHVTRLAKEKAAHIAGLHPEKWVLAADTVVVLGGEILGKPDGKSDAKRMLQSLSGEVHEVYTGYCLANKSKGIVKTDCVVSKVKIKTLADDELNFYLNTDEPYDKAGAYAVQGIGAFMVEEIHGSYTNVVGLPLCQVIDAMHVLKIIKMY